MSETFKHMGFCMLVILVTISAIYTWAETDRTLGESIGISGVEQFKAGSLMADVNTFTFQVTHMITGNVLSDLVMLVPNLATFFMTTWNIFIKLMFGWAILLYAIFNAIGMPVLTWVFVPPIAIIEIIGGLYFFRDIVNTVRGVKG